MKNLFFLTVICLSVLLASCSKEESTFFPTNTEISSNKLPPSGNFSSCNCADIAYGTGSPYCPVSAISNDCQQYRNPILLPWGATQAEREQAYWTQKFNLFNCLEEIRSPLPTTGCSQTMVLRIDGFCTEGLSDTDGWYPLGGSQQHFMDDVEDYTADEVLSYLHCLFSTHGDLIGQLNGCGPAETLCSDGSVITHDMFDHIEFIVSPTGALSIQVLTCLPDDC